MTEAALEKKQDDTVTLVPVPDDDIIKCAKLKCSLCLGRGKMIVKSVGGEDPKTIICTCALKRFVAENGKRLAVNREKKLFYREVPEGEEDQKEEDFVVPERENLKEEERLLLKFQGILDRVSIIDKELAEISARYDHKLQTLENEVGVKRANLAWEKEPFLGHEAARDRRKTEIARLDGDLAELAREQQALQQAKDLASRYLAETEEILSSAATKLQPFVAAVEAAQGRVEDLTKKRHQAMKPHEQRKASLLKRMSHKAASLGLSMEHVLEVLGKAGS